MAIAFGLQASNNVGAVGTTVTVTIPAVSANDVVLVFGLGGAAGTISISSTGTSLTALTGVPLVLASSEHGGWYFVASGTDSGKVITLSTTGSAQKMGLVLASYTGVLTSAPVDQQATHSDNALAVSTHVAPTVTTVTDQDWVIQAMTGKDSTTTSWTVPGTQRSITQGTGAGAPQLIITDGNAAVSSGTVQGGGSFVSGQGVTGAGFVTWTVALSPPPSGTNAPAGLAAATGVPPSLNDSVTLNMTIQGV